MKRGFPAVQKLHQCKQREGYGGNCHTAAPWRPRVPFSRAAVHPTRSTTEGACETYVGRFRQSNTSAKCRAIAGAALLKKEQDKEPGLHSAPAHTTPSRSAGRGNGLRESRPGVNTGVNFRPRGPGLPPLSRKRPSLQTFSRGLGGDIACW